MYDYIVPIVVAVISFAGTWIGSCLANRKSSALMLYRIEQLEKAVNKHNNIDTRTTILEHDVDEVKKAVTVHAEDQPA